MTPGARVGRFELRRELGRGAQASVWLAHDPRLDREVALKLLNAGAGGSDVDAWLHEARSVSRLSHPNVVPVFEADRHGSQPYFVFEYVPGRTLAETLRERGALPAREAVTLMLGILDALAAAHAQGIVHRDLKPSNVLLGEDGRPRVMDFGIATRLDAGGAHRGVIVGTPGYLSPEAARGERPTPALDVFSAGVVLGEMLGGTRLLPERDPRRAIERVQHEDLDIPAQAPVEDTLRAAVRRALERDTRLRYASVQELHAALTRWLDPDTDAESPAAAGHGTLDFLLRRMRRKGDFPALSESVVRIQRVATSETDTLARLSAEILKDVALTNKLLRVVNTAHFSTAGGAVSTVSRAVALVGFATIRDMALSLVLLEHMRDKAHASQLKEEFLRALMAGTLADELSAGARDGEETFLGSMFQNLGRMLTEYYFPEEAEQIRGLLDGRDAPARVHEAAAARVLGIGFEELGVGIARSWGLPETLLRTMRAPEGEAPARPVERGVERQRWLGRLGNEMADAMLFLEPEALPERLAELGARYAPGLGMAARDIVKAADTARQRLAELVPAMGVQTARGARARRLLQAQAPAEEADTLSALQLDAQTVAVAQDTQGRVAPAPPAMVDVLAAGIQDITNTMVADDFRLNEVLRMVLETMYRALDFRRIVFCLRDPKTETLTGRFGLGEGVDAVSRVFRVPLRPGPTPDLFAAVCAKGMDTLIADATAANIVARLPAWYREQVAAPSFLLLPMTLKNSTFALIYADKAEPGTPGLGEKELALLRTLRNQAVMAFRQRG
ncbi:serine/threonine protein kinase [Rubrivivax benzoatilyticus]|uniref:HDOD domain-containing protein n=1 Tax=Rubrivivax benzoatilyticus TaxID=316997 RepID=A0ABX0I0D3_9BURK|nr:serine/threonine protein kinase [Rubrivivax benzoatilyticus]EGJ10605.1 serine/threonine protein kinase [Rubrivivax benzoatilyticus JA2 = ATCC BAA-35]NHK99030.1 HDOD domain-containing protein [Rubrivivax benzoatilyticus]NHL25107.1 HDOD domain-containing protein [Rubrivivax benzoatilyticus]